MVRLLVPLMLAIAFFSACRHPSVSIEHQILNGTWTYDQKLKFDWTIEDTFGLYDILLVIHHGTDLDYHNVYVKSKTSFPQTKTVEQVFSLELLDPSGKPQGSCRGNSCSSTIPLNEKIRFPDIGSYGLEIEQFSRKDSIPGIQALRLEIWKTKD